MPTSFAYSPYIYESLIDFIHKFSPFVVEQKEQQASSNQCTYSGDEMVLESAEDFKIRRKEVRNTLSYCCDILHGGKFHNIQMLLR